MKVFISLLALAFSFETYAQFQTKMIKVEKTELEQQCSQNLKTVAAFELVCYVDVQDFRDQELFLKSTSRSYHFSNVSGARLGVDVQFKGTLTGYRVSYLAPWSRSSFLLSKKEAMKYILKAAQKLNYPQLKVFYLEEGN